MKEADKILINKTQSWNWVIYANPKVETEAVITTCQEQARATNYKTAHIMKSGKDPNCRLNRSHQETIFHIVSVCSILMKKAYAKIKSIFLTYRI